MELTHCAGLSPIVIIATGPHMSWMNWTCQNLTYMATNDPNLSKIIIVLDFVIVINGTEMNPTSPRYQKISSKDGNYTELANKLQFLRFPSNGNLNERESQKIEINTGNSCYLSAARRRRGRFFSPIGSGPGGSGLWNEDRDKHWVQLLFISGSSSPGQFFLLLDLGPGAAAGGMGQL